MPMTPFFSRFNWRKLFLAGCLSLYFYLSAATPAHAQIMDWKARNSRCVQDVSYTSGGEAITITDVATFQGFECLIGNILGAATTIIGLASFVMIIVGAFLYLTSGGNTKGTEAAKQTITYAIIGILVSLMAYFILYFVSSFTGVGGILNFSLNIQQP